MSYRVICNTHNTPFLDCCFGTLRPYSTRIEYSPDEGFGPNDARDTADAVDALLSQAFVPVEEIRRRVFRKLERGLNDL